MEFDAVVEAIEEDVVPDDEAVTALEAAIEDLTERADRAIETLPVAADTVLVGSTARGTWLAGDRDIDLFVRFPTDLDREKLEEYGLAVGHSVVDDGREEYAEHPYVTGTHRGFDVDCVPCYDVESASAIRSAVDRTPFHTAYLDGRVDGVTDDVRVFKALLRAIGAYGSDLRTRGFSGFLTELLVVEHGGLRPLLEAAADWQPPVSYDPERHGERSFDDPLVVIDPTDPTRNVAAVCSATNVARLIHYARELLETPRVELFEPRVPESLSVEAARKRIESRSTTPVAVRFESPDVVDDQLYPQLDSSLSGLVGALDRAGFGPLRADRFVDTTAVLLVECAIERLPAIERHVGPPVGVREHAEEFYRAYADDPDVTGPFLDDDRYVVERTRDARTPAELLDAKLFEISLGTHVESALEANHEILTGDGVAELASEFGPQLAAYFDPVP